MQHRKEEIIEKVGQCLEIARQKYGYTLVPEIRFDLRGTCMGYALWGQNEHAMRFNVEALCADDSKWDHLLNDTVPHEVAHLVCAEMFPNEVLGKWCNGRRKNGKPHGRRWQQVCRALGGTGKRCHSQKLAKARRTKQYLYRAVCGFEFWMGAVRHNKLQRNWKMFYRFRNGAILSGEHYTGEMRVT